MSLRVERLLFWLGSLAGLLVLAWLVPSPGYMDAQYYYLGGKSLFIGQGFIEPYLWNFLNDPAGLPQPSHLYWMPLPSVLSWLGMAVTGRGDFSGGRLVFILLASLLPLVSSLAAKAAGLERKEIQLASFLAVFSGFYWVYLTLPETFVPALLLGGLFLLVLLAGKKVPLVLQAGVLGGLSGLMHMTRADGLLWLVAAGIFIAWNSLCSGGRKSRLLLNAGVAVGVLVAAYLVVSGAWYARNINLFGSLMPPGNSRALWIETYNQTFVYPANTLNFANWLAENLGRHVAVRLDALGGNLVTLVVVNGLVVLFPLAAAGLWRWRKQAWVRIMLGTAATIFLVMTLAFPFAGSRGGLFHSMSGIQVLVWIAAPVGLKSALEWGQRRRDWDAQSAWKVFSAGLVGLCALISVLVLQMRIAINPTTQLGWNGEEVIYQQVEERLIDIGAPLLERIMVANPVGYYLVSGREAVVTPDSPLDLILQAAEKYRVCWLAVEPDHVTSLGQLYVSPDFADGFCYQETIGAVKLFRFCGMPECKP